MPTGDGDWPPCGHDAWPCCQPTTDTHLQGKDHPVPSSGLPQGGYAALQRGPGVFRGLQQVYVVTLSFYVLDGAPIPRKVGVGVDIDQAWQNRRLWASPPTNYTSRSAAFSLALLKSAPRPGGCQSWGTSSIDAS